MAVMTNLYKLFRSLAAEPPLLVGTVTAYAAGTATVELPDGGIVTAHGVAAVNDRVFVRGGRIDGPAPALPVELIDV